MESTSGKSHNQDRQDRCAIFASGSAARNPYYQHTPECVSFRAERETSGYSFESQCHHSTGARAHNSHSIGRRFTRRDSPQSFGNTLVGIRLEQVAKVVSDQLQSRSLRFARRRRADCDSAAQCFAFRERDRGRPVQCRRDYNCLAMVPPNFYPIARRHQLAE